MSPERLEEIGQLIRWFGEASKSYPDGNPRRTADAAVELLEEVERLQADRDSWRRVCERLEGESRALREERKRRLEARRLELHVNPLEGLGGGS